MNAKKSSTLILTFIILYLLVGTIFPFIFEEKIEEMQDEMGNVNIDFTSKVLSITAWPLILILMGATGMGIIWHIITITILAGIVLMSYSIESIIFREKKPKKSFNEYRPATRHNKNPNPLSSKQHT
jgi:uncharacterized membrane protein